MTLPRITTAFTRLLDIEVPVICAPMAKVTSPTLVAEATIGGGYGFLAAGYQSTETIKAEIASTKSLLTAAKFKQGAHKLPIGIAYFGWELDKYGDQEAHKKLDIALDSDVESIWLSFGSRFDKWVKYIRDKEEEKPIAQKTKLFILVNNLGEARAAYQLGADVIVAQGNEAGGHGSGSAPPAISLVTSILQALPENRPPIVAAGGFSTGAQIAAMLTLGASAVAFGTRFLLTPDSRYSTAQKAALVAAHGNATKRSIAWDQARNTVDWPDGIDGRGLYTKLVKDFESGVDISHLQQKVKDNLVGGDIEYQVTWSGAGVGEMSEVKGTKDILNDFRFEIVDRLRASQTLVKDARPHL
ncbi:2-nitropropane dioxygenase [Irpex rosettiformis]|uniref:2-nitropropane dioxygenase n=1 Tax=Irpex rosettiformis TaxID=378272 RepID=A0ACB8UC07_9APHY|nr:2-nitropropane dioxygenase [Irpex rosettiformis]